MSEERRQILQMLAEGKVTADEAGQLLDALGAPAVAADAADLFDVPVRETTRREPLLPFLLALALLLLPFDAWAHRPGSGRTGA